MAWEEAYDNESKAKNPFVIIHVQIVHIAALLLRTRRE